MPTRSWGYFEAQMNGQTWHKTYKNAYQRTQAIVERPDSCANTVGYLACNLFSSKRILRQEFIFSDVPLEPGRYNVVPHTNKPCNTLGQVAAVFYTSIDDGDVAGDTYKVLETKNNFIEVEEYNTSTKEIKGRFQVTFIPQHIAYGHFLPDTLKFTEGKFHTKFVNP